MSLRAEPTIAGDASLSDGEFESRRDCLIRQVQMRGVTDPEVIAALRAVARHKLVPPPLIDSSYEDRPLPIGSEQTISQPTIVGLMSQWAIEGAESDHRRRVLEIGTGSGYQAAVLAELFDEVFSLEVRPELAARAKSALSRLGGRAQRVCCAVGDGSLGLDEFAPFDAIVVTAAAPSIPKALLGQLASHGRLVIPLVIDSENQLLHLFVRVEDGAGNEVKKVRSLPVLFVPLVSKPCP